ncbi:MAG: hypothetical protein U0793_07555 [Gemmataceae bacterium]
MDAKQVAARFAAHAWYEETRRGAQAPNEAARFAHKHWEAFLPVAQEGLGRLLIRLGAAKRSPRKLRRGGGGNVAAAS